MTYFTVLPSLTSVAVTVTALSLLYTLILVVYRLYLSPVAHIPGPFLGRITYWYEAYYDVLLGGQYSFKIPQLHEQYGPIVRINPHEVHFSDPDFYDEIYTGSSKRRNKWGWQTSSYDLDASFFAAPDHDVHRVGRAAMANAFSMASARKWQPMIEGKITKALNRFRENRGLNQPLQLHALFSCLTNDITMEFTFGWSYDRITHPTFDPPYVRATLQAGMLSPVMKHFPFLNPLVQRVFPLVQSFFPESVVLALHLDMRSYSKFRKDVQEAVREAQTLPDKNDRGSNDEVLPVIPGVMLSDAPDIEKSFNHLYHNGQMLVLAGTNTTGPTLAVIFCYLLGQPTQLKRLREEIFAAIPDPDANVSLPLLQQLPYLSAVIQEGLRIANGTSTRAPRIDPQKPTMFIDRSRNVGKEYVIPPGTPMSMTSMHVHQNPNIYPEPFNFKPERWLNGNSPGEKYFHPFYKGTRACLGINLAYVELYLIIARILRRYGGKGCTMETDEGYLELYKTTPKNVEIVRDGFNCIWPDELEGVRVVVKSLGV